MAKLTVSLIVHGDFTHIGPALHSLYATTRTPFKVYVTINVGSGQEIDALRESFPDVKILVNETPRGFAANHNRVLQLADTPYVALLNDDIVLHSGALDAMVTYLNTHPKVGLAGAALLNTDGTPQTSVFSDPSLLRIVYKVSGLAALTHQESRLRRILLRLGVGRVVRVESLRTDRRTRTVPVVNGAVMLVRRAAYAQVGRMDETTIVYGEEVDWHWRMRRAGWQVAHVAEAVVTHHGSGHLAFEMPGWMLIEDRKAILNYFLKHRPGWQTAVIRTAIVLSHGFWGTVWLPFARERAQTHFKIVHLGLSWRRS
ncbi:MAG: glycosyltransferase [Anaerolineae bacterium]|nr:glycosyltransferase [Anaerolineae bacterium]